MLTVERRGKVPLNISFPDFDKGARCPGWSGEAWRYNKVDWCDGALAPGQDRWALRVRTHAPAPGVPHATELPGFFTWRLRMTTCCNTLVLPQLTMFLFPSSWVSREPGTLTLAPPRRTRATYRPGPAVSHIASWMRRLRFQLLR